MLMMLHSVCCEALEVFYAADNAVDTDLVADLERMVERTRGEIEDLAARAKASY